MVAREDRERRLRGALAQRGTRRSPASLWVGLLLIAAAVVLFMDIVGGIALPVPRLYPRAMALAGLVACMTVAWRPKWAVPLFIVVMAPLRTLSLPRQISPMGVPMSALALSIVALAAFWWLWPTRPRKLERMSRADVVMTALYLLFAASAIPALLARPYGSSSPVVNRIIFVHGVLLPVILFLVIRSWLRTYKDPTTIARALLASCIVALASGVVQIYAKGLGVSNSSEASMFRYDLLGFAGANNSGIILVMLYPLVFLVFPRGSKLGTLATSLGALGFWAIGIVSLSRSTPIVLGIETLAVLALSARRMAVTQVLLCLCLAGGLALSMAPDSFVQTWTDRFRETDLLGHITGNARRVSPADQYRFQIQRELLYQIKQRPQGGYGATGTVDPENLYLDTGLQFGWAALALLLILQAYALGLSLVTSRRGPPVEREVAKSFLVGTLGAVLYGVTTGVNLVKVADPHGRLGYAPNGIVSVVIAIFMALLVTVALERTRPPRFVSLRQPRPPSGAAQPV